jgi:hypothetical protein
MPEISEQELSALWTQVWYDNNGYYDGLPKEVREKIQILHADLLDQSREKIYGIKLAPRDTTEITKPEEPVSTSVLALHDPALYSFGEKKLWIGFAQNMPSGAKRGTRPRGYPDGALIHWTSGHRNGIQEGGAFQKASGMHYLVVDKDGNVGQGDPLNTHGYHGGASSYAGISGTVSDELLGIENQAAGTLRKSGDWFFPWWDEGKNLPQNRISPVDVIYSPKKGNIAAGYYHKFTLEQMLANRKVLCWLHLNNPDVFKIKFIVGHDEVSPGRKTDPGAALVDVFGNPMTMSDFRDQIADDVRVISANRK